MEYGKLQLVFGQVPKALLFENGMNRADGFTGDYKAYYSWLCTELEKTL